MKLLDPGSTVREGEFATAEQTRGVDQKAVGLYNKLLSGERLTEDQRKAFIGRSQKLYGPAEGRHQKRIATYAGLAKSANLDPAQVVVDLGIVAPEKIKTYNPQTGEFE